MDQAFRGNRNLARSYVQACLASSRKEAKDYQLFRNPHSSPSFPVDPLGGLENFLSFVPKKPGGDDVTLKSLPGWFVFTLAGGAPLF